MKKTIAFIMAFGMMLGAAACEPQGGTAPAPSVPATSTENPTSKEESTEETTEGTTEGTTIEETTVEAAPDPVVTEVSRPALKISGDAEFDEEGRFFNQMEVSYTYVLPREGEENIHAELAKKLTARKEEVVKKYKGLFNEWLDEARAWNESAESYEDVVSFTIHEASYIRRADPYVVSVLEEEKSFLGEDDYWTFDARNYDVLTGSEIALADVVSDVDAFYEIAAAHCEEQELERDAFMALIDAKKGEGKEVCWTMEPQGITIWLDSGAVDGKEYGAHQTAVLFSELAGILTGKYTASTGTQTASVPMDSEMVFDAGADGKRDILSITTDVDEYGTIEDVEIRLGEKTYVEDEIYTYSCNPTLLITESGKCVLYVEYSFANDYRSLGIYDLNGSEPERVEMRNEHFAQLYSENDYASIPFTNPDDYLLTTRLDLLSTVSGDRKAHTDDNGLPVPDTEIYTFAYDVTIYALQPITVDLIDKDTGEVTRKDIEIPKGESLKLYKSDNKTYVDAIIQSGNMVRIYVVTENEWPITVNGKDIYECFEGMIFAG